MNRGGFSQQGSPAWLLAAAALLAPETALAAGGPHVIDDSEVEAAGDCHLESWVTGSSGDQWHANGGLGCTPEAIPTLELGGFVSHAWSPSSDDTMLGLTPKLTLRPTDTGLGVALAGSLSYGLDRSRLETASLIAAATVPAGESLRVNLNGGWVWSKAGPGSELVVGAQAEWQVSPGLSLMAEAFTRNHGLPGGQAGVRWTTGKWPDRPRPPRRPLRRRRDAQLGDGWVDDAVVRAAVKVAGNRVIGTPSPEFSSRNSRFRSRSTSRLRRCGWCPTSGSSGWSRRAFASAVLGHEPHRLEIECQPALAEEGVR